MIHLNGRATQVTTVNLGQLAANQVLLILVLKNKASYHRDYEAFDLFFCLDDDQCLTCSRTSFSYVYSLPNSNSSGFSVISRQRPAKDRLSAGARIAPARLESESSTALSMLPSYLRFRTSHLLTFELQAATLKVQSWNQLGRTFPSEVSNLAIDEPRCQTRSLAPAGGHLLTHRQIPAGRPAEPQQTLGSKVLPSYSGFSSLQTLASVRR